MQLGYKEIEVSFPSASETDFAFTRSLVETAGVVPDDVWLQVLSPCRKELIRRTVDSLKGANKAILHLYLATSPCFQQIVFNMDNAQSLALAVECTRYARSITKDDPSQAGTHWHYEFSPETFSDSDPAFVVQVCEAVKAAWEPSARDPLIFNLPATVEMATPNVYADQIEYFCRHISERETVCVSLHPHNDRGCAVAAAELAQMAGADRVEGTLFGNGERTGNVDLVTLALNLYTQGIHPGIDFSDVPAVIDLVEKSNNIPVHPRAPYGGELVVCAFSGSHQDAIKKGFAVRSKQQHDAPDAPWRIPYLPLDPQDIGRTYEAIIRVNSQSGKGGVAWIVQRTLDLDLPRGLQVAFSHVVQRRADAIGRELLPREIQRLFEREYHLTDAPRIHLVDYDMTADRSSGSPVRARSVAAAEGSGGAAPARAQPRSNAEYKRLFSGVVELDGVERHIAGSGNGPVSSLATALADLGLHIDVGEYKEHSISQRGGGGGAGGVDGGDVDAGQQQQQQGSTMKAVAYIECIDVTTKRRAWGVGINADVTQASLLALLAAASSVRFLCRLSSPPACLSHLHNSPAPWL